MQLPARQRLAPLRIRAWPIRAMRDGSPSLACGYTAERQDGSAYVEPIDLLSDCRGGARIRLCTAMDRSPVSGYEAFEGAVLTAHPTYH